MKIFDKAAWQIDGGISEEIVIAHFTAILEWLQSMNMLSADGEEILEIGIDDSVSLNEKMLSEEGNEFLTKYYDEIIAKSKYISTVVKDLLDSYYKEFKK